MKLLKKASIGVGVALLGIQLLPTHHDNPAVTGELQAPGPVLEILRRACYDCHSNETSWPWYTHVAPVAQLVEHDVTEGREHLNFSEWDRLSASEQAHAIEECWEEVEEGEMPLWFYTPLHPEAKLSAADLEVLRAWAAPYSGRGGEDHDD